MILCSRTRSGEVFTAYLREFDIRTGELLRCEDPDYMAIFLPHITSPSIYVTSLITGGKKKEMRKANMELQNIIKERNGNVPVQLLELAILFRLLMKKKTRFLPQEQ